MPYEKAQASETYASGQSVRRLPPRSAGPAAGERNGRRTAEGARPHSEAGSGTCSSIRATTDITRSNDWRMRLQGLWPPRRKRCRAQVVMHKNYLWQAYMKSTEAPSKRWGGMSADSCWCPGRPGAATEMICQGPQMVSERRVYGKSGSLALRIRTWK